MSIVILVYLVGALAMLTASRGSAFRPGVNGFLETCFVALAWPLVFVVRVIIFLIEGNLWTHLDD